MRCASICHRDHYLSQPAQGQAICQCGLLPHCLLKERPNLRVQCTIPFFRFHFHITYSRFTSSPAAPL